MSEPAADKPLPDSGGPVKVQYNELGIVIGYGCYSCGGPVKQNNVGDDGTTFFRCEKCGQKNWRLRNLEKEKFLGPLREAVRLQKDPEILKKFMLNLSRTVKRDYVTKNMVFLTGLSAYTRNPINLFLRGQSSIGKTYNVTQTLRYFPEEDVWMLGGLSPTALVHSYGITVDGKGEEIDFSQKPSKKATEEEKREWNERVRTARTVVDLHGKILVFLEAPHLETYNMLRPILSHDKEEINYKFTEKTAQGSFRTQHVIVRGWPATIFCTTDERYIEDLATRGFTATPETSLEKFKEAVALTGERKAFPWKFEDDNDSMLLKGFFNWLRSQLQELNVLIPYARELAEHYPAQYARSMRDINHLTALIEVITLFHCMQRPVLTRQVKRLVLTGEGETQTEEKHYVLATLEDLEYVLGLWQSVEETTVTGLPEHILDFFHKAVEPLSEKVASFSIEDLTREYNEKARERKSSDTIQRWVKYLCDVGWVSKEPDPLDKRKVLVHVIKKPENNRDLTQFLNAVNFTLENFKAWLNEAKQITAQNHLTLKKNLLADEPSTPEEVFQDFFSSEKGLRAVISPSPNQTAIAERASELAVNQKCGDLRIIPTAMTIDNILGWLRLEFQKGNNPIREGPVALKPIENGHCPLCGEHGNLTHQIQFSDGTRIDAFCLSCFGKIYDLVEEFRNRELM